MQTEKRNMQTDCSTIIAWEILIEDNDILNVHYDACSLCVYKSIKKKEVQVFISIKYTIEVLNIMGKRVVIPNGTEIVLIDTCTFINLEQSRGTAANRAAVLKVSELDGLLCISDLSFVELVLGCKDVNQLKNHFENLKSMDFVIFGRCDELQSLLSIECVVNVINRNSLKEYKQKLKIVRNNILFPVFRAIFITYC